MTRVVERTKSQAVHRRDRTCTHREDIAENSADSCCSTLKRFDETRMIMRLDLESDAPVVTDIDDTGILSGGNDHTRSAGRKSFEMYSRRLVRTVLRPHHAEHTELGHVRLASHDRLDFFVFFGCEIVLSDDFRRDFRHVM